MTESVKVRNRRVGHRAGCHHALALAGCAATITSPPTGPPGFEIVRQQLRRRAHRSAAGWDPGSRPPPPIALARGAGLPALRLIEVDVGHRLGLRPLKKGDQHIFGQF